MLVFPNGDKEAIAKAHPELDVNVCEKGNVYAVAPAGSYHFEYKPTQPLHLVISLDMSVEEAMSIPEVKAVILEELPMARRFMEGGPDGNGSASLRAILEHSGFMFNFPADLAERLEKRLSALN